jgi:hypothetical protein
VSHKTSAARILSMRWESEDWNEMRINSSEDWKPSSLHGRGGHYTNTWGTPTSSHLQPRKTQPKKIGSWLEWLDAKRPPSFSHSSHSSQLPIFLGCVFPGWRWLEALACPTYKSPPQTSVNSQWTVAFGTQVNIFQSPPGAERAMSPQMYRIHIRTANSKTNRIWWCRFVISKLAAKVGHPVTLRAFPWSAMPSLTGPHSPQIPQSLSKF